MYIINVIADDETKIDLYEILLAHLTQSELLPSLGVRRRRPS
jgi:hypothetical protein